MAYTHTNNQSPATGAVAMYALVAALVTAGWVKQMDSDGTTYSSSGVQVTSGAAGAGGLGNTSAWIRLKHPTQVWEITIQRGTTNLLWRVKFGRTAFSGGSPAATVTPNVASAANEVIVVGGGTDASPTYSTTNHTDNTYKTEIAVGGAAENYGWSMVHMTNTTAVSNHMFTFSPTISGTYVASDTDPYVICFNTNVTTGSVTTTLGKAWNGTAFVTVNLGSYYINATKVWPASGGTNTFDSSDPVPNAFWGTTGGTIKGWDQLLKYDGVSARATGSLVTDLATGDRLNVGGICFPWNNAAWSI